MSCEIPDGFYDFDEVVREARATYTPEELARECELEERAEEQLERLNSSTRCARVPLISVVHKP